MNYDKNKKNKNDEREGQNVNVSHKGGRATTDTNAYDNSMTEKERRNREQQGKTDTFDES